MDPQTAKKIAILGAGPSGLVAAKEVLENGMIPTIFEKQKELGGVWHPVTGSVWNSMHTNISKFTTCYGDFPWPQDIEMFPSVQSMFTYLNEYAEKWKLKPLIKFQSKILKVSAIPNANGTENTLLDGSKGWSVSWIENGTKKTEEFDGVIAATGIFAKANKPTFKGLETFPGKTIHSNEYKTGSQFEGLRVLTIGGSFSGAEIASDVTNYAKSSIHCFREPFWILKRYLPDSTNNQANLPVDLLFYNRKFYAKKETLPPMDEVNKGKNTNMQTLCKDQQDVKSLKVPTESFVNPINVCISDQYLQQVKQGKLQPKKNTIIEIKGSKIIFQNGDIQDVDVIIFATGFNVDNSFFDKKVLEKISYEETDRVQPLILFNATLHPDLENLFFIGMYKGPYFGVMEQQARWSARVLSNKVQLPPYEEMLEGLKKEKAIRDQIPRPQFPHADYVLFADKISKCGKSFPDLKKLEMENYSLADAFGKPLKSNAYRLEHRKSEIFNRFMSEPVTPAHYNLVDDPVTTLNQMDFVVQVVKQFL